MQRTAIIVNPKSGTRSVNDRISTIRAAMPAGIEFDIFVIEKPGDRQEILLNALSGRYTSVAVAGGDGTVNFAAAFLAGKEIPLAIIPMGSGNGLARHLGIPHDLSKALLLIKEGRVRKIDAAYINEKAFFCTAGVGFDAHIGKLFAGSQRRGLRTYAEITIRQLRLFKPSVYCLEIDGIRSEHEAFLITFANASQYGGNAFIAPRADISDGLLDICIFRPFPFLRGIPLAIRLFNKTIHHSKDVSIVRGRHIILRRGSCGPVQYDGEPDMMGTVLEIRIEPGSLNVFV